MLLDTMEPGDYFRFNPYMSEEFNLDENRLEKWQMMQHETKMYMRRNDYNFKMLSKQLLKPKSKQKKSENYLISENNKTITIVNKTTDVLTILSTAPIYNITYAPDGTHSLEIMKNGTATLRYIYDVDNKLTIYAAITQ